MFSIILCTPIFPPILFSISFSNLDPCCMISLLLKLILLFYRNYYTWISMHIAHIPCKIPVRHHHISIYHIYTPNNDQYLFTLPCIKWLISGFTTHVYIQNRFAKIYYHYNFTFSKRKARNVTFIKKSILRRILNKIYTRTIRINTLTFSIFHESVKWPVRFS